MKALLTVLILVQTSIGKVPTIVPVPKISKTVAEK